MRTVKIRIALEDCVGKYGLNAEINPEMFGTGVCDGCTFYNYCDSIRNMKEELNSCKKY